MFSSEKEKERDCYRRSERDCRTELSSPAKWLLRLRFWNARLSTHPSTDSANREANTEREDTSERALQQSCLRNSLRAPELLKVPAWARGGSDWLWSIQKKHQNKLTIFDKQNSETKTSHLLQVWLQNFCGRSALCGVGRMNKFWCDSLENQLICWTVLAALKFGRFRPISLSTLEQQ